MSREDILAEAVSNGAAVHPAGASFGWTKGQTARVWANIKKQLGEQAK